MIPLNLKTVSDRNNVKIFIPSEKVVAIKPRDWIQEKDRQSVLNATASILGCARSGLDIVENASKMQSFLVDIVVSVKSDNSRSP